MLYAIHMQEELKAEAKEKNHYLLYAIHMQKLNLT